LIEDQPGELARIRGIIAGMKGNILHIHHSQGEPYMPIKKSRVRLELETRGADHARRIRTAIEGAGFHTGE